MKTYENQNIQYHQNVSLKKHLRHPELESQRLDFARLRFVRQSTHVSIHLLKSSLDPVEQQIKHDRHPQLYTNPADVCGICVKLGVPVMFDLLLYRIKGRFQKMDGHMCALPHETQPRKI